jgi:hypothetical protein
VTPVSGWQTDLEFARDALRRIYTAANGIVIGEEPPRETAQDIQRMAINGLKGREVWPWSHDPGDAPP